MDLGELRREYTRAGLDREHLDPDPICQFSVWFEQAKSAQLIEPNAMTVATVGEGGIPSTRAVLLKAYDARGFVFFTNYESRKAKELAANPNASLHFPWFGLERQVIVIGRAERISTSESAKYFMSRPHGSQLGAWVSTQSTVISSRNLLEMKLAEMKRKFREGKVPAPDFWGGIRVAPESVEFWQGRPNRLHDRFRYTRDEGATWRIDRLAP